MPVRVKRGILLVGLLEHGIILENSLRASILKPIAKDVILRGGLISNVFGDANLLGELIQVPVRINHLLLRGELVLSFDVVLIIFLVLFRKQLVDVVFVKLLFVTAVFYKLRLKVWIDLEFLILINLVRRKRHWTLNEFNVPLSPVVSGSTFLTWDRNI